MAQGTTKGVPIDIDSTLAANSDQLVPSQKAIKTYIDQINLSDLNDISILSTPSTGNVLTFNASAGLWEAKPSAGGEGYISYYLNKSVSQSPYSEFSSTYVAGPDQTSSVTVSSGATATIESFQTPAGVPGVTTIPAGRWAFYLHFSGTLSDSWSIFAEVYTRTTGGVETLRLTTDSAVTNSLSASPNMILTDGVFPQTTILTTDRIVVKIRVTNNSLTSKSITLHTEGTTYYSISSTTLNPSFIVNAVTAVYASLPLASSGGYTPTISISQAGISTDGYLSTTDWNTFNNKVSTTRSISTSSPLSGGGQLSSDLTISIQDAAADGTTKGAATFTAADFNSASGLISIDYTNGQAATSTTKGFLTAADWIDFNSKKSNGRFGIADSTGAYSMYSTLQAAITAATAGQTVEFFTDYTETDAVSVILKNDVNINGNGHTYTLNNSGSNSCLIDNGVAVTCDIANLKLKRIGGAAGSTTGNTCLHITGASKINASTSSLYGSYAAALIINNSGARISNIYAYGGTGNAAYNTVIVTLGILTNSFVDNVANATGNYVSAIVNSGTIIDCSANSSAGNPTIYNSGTALNCTARGVNGAALYNSGIAIGCTAYASGGPAISIYGNCTTENCAGYSTSSHGISINGANTTRVINCTGYSTAGIGISAYNGFLIGCKGFSTTSNGISLTNGNDGQGSIQTCIAISEAAVALALSFQSATKVVDCTIESKWNNSAGHALTASSTFVHLLISNSYQVANASANCINKSLAGTLKYSNSQFIGATTPVNSFITQGIINTNDAYGNITI